MTATASMVAVENVERSGFARHTGEEKDRIEKIWICRSGSGKNIGNIPCSMFGQGDGQRCSCAHRLSATNLFLSTLILK